MEMFFDANNPLWLIILIVVFFALAAYFSAVKIFRPLKKLHQKEKQILELENDNLLVLFTKLNPAPLFRFDGLGRITLNNRAGENILKEFSTEIDNIKVLIPELQNDNLSRLLSTSREHKIKSRINNRDYEIVIIGIPEYNFGHAYFFDITDRLNFEKQLIEKQNKLRELIFNVQDISETTRNQIAMELHDGVCQTLNFVLSSSKSIYGVNGSEENFTESVDYKPVIKDILSEIKSLSYQLSPKFLLELGLVKALEKLVVDISSGKIKGNFKCFDVIPDIDAKLEINIYRICQEIMNNILKHSNAKNFNLQLFPSDSEITLIIDDDGIGFNNSKGEKTKGLGLFNISERVEYLNGHLNIRSIPGTGTEIIINIPIREISTI